jgi:hypothetical protein
MAHEDKNMGIPKPKIGNFEINLNTIVVLLGFATGLVTWGYTLSEFKSNQETNAIAIKSINSHLETNDVRTEALSRTVDAHELRLTAVERQISDAASTMKEVQNSLNNVVTATQVTKEIVTRIEEAQKDAKR